jgi:hypothetical protein
MYSPNSVKVMMSVLRIEGVSVPVLTVVTKEEFIVAGAKQAHWAGTFGEFLMARVVEVWNSDTLGTVGCKSATDRV